MRANLQTKGHFKDCISSHMTIHCKMYSGYLPNDFIITGKGGYVYLHRRQQVLQLLVKYPFPIMKVHHQFLF